MLNKEMYLHFENMLKEADDLDRKKLLNSFQEELTYELTELYINNKKDELDKELHAFKRFNKLLQNETEENFSYQVGVIIGVIRAIELLAHKSSVKNKLNIKMSALFSKDINKKILLYLYDHPDSQHKVIAQDLGIQSNYLSQQMRELEEAGGVVRYGVDRRSFYELTLDGQAFIEKNKVKKPRDLYIDELMQEIELNTKWEGKYTTVPKRFYAFRKRNIPHVLISEGDVINAK